MLDSYWEALDIYRNTSKNYTETYTSLLSDKQQCISACFVVGKCGRYEVALAREEMGDLDGSTRAANLVVRFVFLTLKVFCQVTEDDMWRP